MAVFSVAPDAETTDRATRMRGPVLTLAGLSSLTLALHLHDPHQRYSWGMCPSAALGIWCPACGGLRAVNDLGDGHLMRAASSNLLFVVALPFLVAGLALWCVDRWCGVHRTVSPTTRRRLMRAGIALAVVFTVLRNTPQGAWLAP